MTQVVACSSEVGVLGEGVRWDGRSDRLAWLDITSGVVREAALGPDGWLRTERTHTLDRPVGAVAPAGPDGWVAAAGRGFVHLAADGTSTDLAEAAVGQAGVRMNDGSCDRQGRFWAGTMAEDESPGRGALYRLELDGTVTTVLEGLTISNGIGWTADGRTMFLNDSGPGTIDAFVVDPASGDLGSRRTIATFGGDDGVPDGLVVDEEDTLWVAFYGGGAVRRLTPAGDVLLTVRFPVSQTTACAFGGADGATLFVSSALQGLDEGARVSEPDAGRVFRVEGSGGRAAPALPYLGPVAPG